MIIIGLCGAKRAGKDTAFEAMAEVTPIARVGLADMLKDVCAAVLGITRDHFDLNAYKEREFDTPINLNKRNVKEIFDVYGLKPDYDQFIRPHVGMLLYTPRQVAQYVGSEVLRSYRPDVHCEEALKLCTAPVSMITDIRFPNELTFFKAATPQFYSVYIANRAAEAVAAKDGHVSESHVTELAKKSDFTIENNDSIKVYQDLCRSLIKGLLERK